MALTKIGSSGLDTNAITSDKITADSITEAKIADAAVENEHLNTKIITDQTELSEEAASGDFIIIYDTSVGALKKIQRSNFVLQAPSITSITPTNVDSKDSATTTTFTVTGTGFTTGTTAKLRNNSGADISFNTVTRDSATQLTCVLNNALITPEGVTDEPYDIVVTAANNLAAVLENQINVDQRPVFTTAAGSLGSVADSTRTSTTFTIEATDPESAGTVRYDVLSGSLPAGASLNSSTGVISTFNAVGGDTTSTFTIQASDVDSNVSLREFSITVLAPVAQSFTSSGTFSVPVGVTAVDVLVIAGGGGGGSAPMGGGGGAGGLIFRPGFPVTPGGTVSVTVGCGGGVDTNGQDSVFGTLTAKGGGDGSGDVGGSGGGAYGLSGNEGLANQPTQPGDSGTYGFGFPGGPRAINHLGQPQPTPSSGQMGTGGGGAGAPGLGSHPSNHGGAGGIGKSYSISGTSVKYAGGGGGGGSNSTHGNPADPGGPTFGGGRGASNEGQQGVAGTANRGGGGGGAATGGNVGAGGGKGIVIVAY